jgi:hypothetical protein
MFGMSSNLSTVLANMEKRKERVRLAPITTVNKAAQTGEAMAKKLVRVKTGALRGSIDIFHKGETEKWIGPKKWYGIVVEKGRKGFCAHGVRSGLKRGSVISGTTVDHKQVLRFKGKNGWVFTPCVGPSKPYPFMEPTYMYLRVYFPKLMKENIRKALN